MKRTIWIVVMFLLLQMLVPVVIMGVALLCGIIPNMMAAYAHPGLLAMSVLVTDMLILIWVGLLYFRKESLQRFSWKIMLLAVLTFLPFALLVSSAAEELDLPNWMQATLGDMSNTWTGVLLVVFLGPIVEEFCFRMGIMDGMKKAGYKRWPIILTSALLFGLVHLNPAQMFAAFWLGLFLAWLYDRWGNLWPCIACHIINNGIAVIEMRSFNEDATMRSILGSEMLFWAFCVGCLIAFVFLFSLLQKKTKPKSWTI